MADSIGLNHTDGRHIDDWDHVKQSIYVILTTRIGQRVLRRDFGSHLPDLIDAPMSSRVILALYVAIATALQRWEPRFQLTKCQPVELTAGGLVGIELAGTYYPRGHLGDYTSQQTKKSRLLFAEQQLLDVA